MNPASTVLPPSVLALNALLIERQASDCRLRVALGVSYVSHTLTLAGVLLALGVTTCTPPPDHADFAEISPFRSILDITTVYPFAAPPAPQPAAATAVLQLEDRGSEPQVRHPMAAPRDDADALSKPKRPPARSTVPPLAAASVTTAESELALTQSPGGRTPALTHAAGSLAGWYAARIRDIVYSNWGDPFYGQARPETDLHVLVRFVIERDGRVSASELEGTSGSAAWDRSGLRAVENSKLPPLPPDYPGARLVVHYEFRTTQ